jgi:membrane protein implicated in regulation of membrane protease activity
VLCGELNNAFRFMASAIRRLARFALAVRRCLSNMPEAKCGKSKYIQGGRAWHRCGGDHLQTYLAWFLLAAMALVLEMLSRRAYFLAASIGLLSGGMVALLGGTVILQIVGALAAGAADAFYLRHRMGRVIHDWSPREESEEDEALTFFVEEWDDDATTVVNYRGTPWRATAAPEAKVSAGQYFLKGRSRDQLILANERRRGDRVKLHQG